MKRWRIGIIGTGRHGSRYANHLTRDLKELAELTAISRQSTDQGQEQARTWNTRFHADWRQLVADPAVEAVISVTTPNLNPAIAAACLEHQKPLLMEKPLAVNAAAAQTMVAGFTKAKLGLTVGQTLRYNPIILGLKQELAKVGAIHAFAATHHLEPSTLPWLADPETAGGGVIFHTAVHLFDALRFISGQELIRVRAASYQIHNPRLEDLFSAQIEMSGGLFGIVMAGKVGMARAGRYEFMGEAGLLQGDQVHGRLELVQGMTTTPLPHGPAGPAILPLLRDWLAFLEGEGENPIPGAEGLAAVMACEACRASAASGGWVSVEGGGYETGRSLMVHAPKKLSTWATGTGLLTRYPWMKSQPR